MNEMEWAVRVRDGKIDQEDGTLKNGDRVMFEIRE